MMTVTKWLVWLSYLAIASTAAASDLPGAIWWSAEGLGARGRGGVPSGVVKSAVVGRAGPDGSKHAAPGDSTSAATHGRSVEQHAVESAAKRGGRGHDAGVPPPHVRAGLNEGGQPPVHVLERMRQGGMPSHSMPGTDSAPSGHGGGQSGGRPGGQSPSRAEMLAMLSKPKPLLLCWGAFPATEGKDSPLGQLVDIEKMKTWIRLPNGSMVAAGVNMEQDTVVTKCPPESKADSELPNGVYVVGMHLDAGIMDFDADGELERVHFYANALASRFSRDGDSGSDPDVLFRDAEKVALEIGPITTGTGRGGFLTTSQTAMEENKLQVLYQGAPLANAEVSVLSDSGWQNRLMTDEQGILTVVPVGKKSDGRVRMTPADQCLYVVLHKVRTPGELGGRAYASEYHCASLLLGVRMPGPEWKSKSEGFRLATVSGVGFLVLAGGFGIYRRRRRAAEIMVQFDRHRISRGDL